MPWLNALNATRGYVLLVLIMPVEPPSAHPASKLGFVKKLHMLIEVPLE
jgi:hypothetical protein